MYYIKIYYVLVPFECITKPDDEDVNDILELGQSLPVKVKELLSVKASIFFLVIVYYYQKLFGYLSAVTRNTK